MKMEGLPESNITGQSARTSERHRMQRYRFYGWEQANVAPLASAANEFPSIHNPRDLYDALLHVWCAETCAPRLRERWTPQNPTLGQCSITAFLAQDVFGGKVYGILRPDGNYHCYNVVDDSDETAARTGGGPEPTCEPGDRPYDTAHTVCFDLTSEQFGDERLSYVESNPEQFRAVHFAKEEKRQRYELLKRQLAAYLRS